MSKREEIKEYVGKFVEGLAKMMHAASIEAVDAAFVATDGEGDSAGGGPKVRVVKSVRRARAPKQLPAAAPNGGEPQKQVLAVVRANQGCGGGLIKAQTGLPQWQLGRTLKDLVSIGAIKKSGNGRGTTYATR
jgi:hypothetical protein